MTFARRSRGLYTASSLARRGQRPSRVCRPILGLECFEPRTLLSIALVSVDAAGTASGNAASDFQTTQADELVGDGYISPISQATLNNLSADGTKLVFASDATNLVAGLNDTNQATDVFVRNMTSGQTSLVSETPGGAAGNGPSFDPVISPDGRYVAFMSLATNLSSVAAPDVALPPGDAYLYIRDLQTGSTTLLEQTPSGQAADGWSTGQFVFSPNSEYLAFVDSSDNLTSAPVENGPASNSGSGDLPAGAFGAPTYVYIRNLGAQTTTLASLSTNGQASGNNPVISGPLDLVFSPDSQSLVFDSSATDLTANLPDNTPNSLPGANENIFLYSLPTAKTTLISVTASGLQAGGNSGGAVFRPDGKSVAFISDATDLTANAVDPTPLPGAAELGPSDWTTNIFIRNLATDTTTLVSATPKGLQSNGTAAGIAFSPDGGSLAYMTSATDLTNNLPDPTPAPGASSSFPGLNVNVFITNLTTGVTTLVSATPNGDLSNGSATQILFSPDGKSLAFVSGATDLTNNPFELTPPSIPGGASDDTVPGPDDIGNVFVRNLTTNTTTLASVTTGGQLPNTNVSGLIFSPDSQSLFFQSGAIDLTSNPPDTASTSLAGSPPPLTPMFGGSNLFVRDLTDGTTSLISATTAGKLSENTEFNAILSPDRQTLFFDSSVDNLVSDDSNGFTDIFAASAPFIPSNQIQFGAWEYAANESAGQVAVTVLRSGPATAPASVSYSVQNGTAQAGTDFKAISGTLNFAADQTSATLNVPLVAGDYFAGTRSATVVLSNPQGATLGYPSTILHVTSSTAPAAPVVQQAGPTVVSVAVQKPRHGSTSLVITFNQALTPSSALDAANYAVSLPGRTIHGRRGHITATRPGRALAIAKVAYDSATHQVTLTVRKQLAAHSGYQLQINGSSGGISNTSGTALNSPGTLMPGKDYVGALG
jgi:Tol biopolymer transport system component